MDPAIIDQFLCLSEALTGEAQLGRQLAAEYLERVRAMPQGAHLEKLLGEFDAIVVTGGDIDAAIEAKIMGVDELRGIAKVLILMWYFGEVSGQPSSEGHPEHYFQGKFWSIVGAHVPGLSGGYFGHWSYPPDS